MPRRAKPKAPPPLRRVAMPPPPRIEPRALARWCSRHGATLARPPEAVAAELDGIAADMHSARAAPRVAPSSVLDWIEHTDQAASRLLALLADAEAVALLAPEASPEDVAGLTRLRAALAASRPVHLARAMIATGGPPRTGRPEARAALARIAREAFAAPLTRDQRDRFTAWFFAQIDGRNRGKAARGCACASAA